MAKNKTLRDLLEEAGSVDADSKVSYIIWSDKENGVSLSTLDYEEDRTINYPLGWKTAAFVGYCLIQESLLSEGEKVVDYLINLAVRRKDIINLMKECSGLFQIKKDDNGKEKETKESKRGL